MRYIYLGLRGSSLCEAQVDLADMPTQGRAMGKGLSVEVLRQQAGNAFRNATNHEKGSHNPVHEDAKRNLFPDTAMREYLMQDLIPNLA